MSCTICCKWPMISNLRSSEWLLRMRALQRQLQVFTEMKSGTVFLGRLTIFSPMLFLRTFCESNAWDFHLVMTKIFTLSWPRFPETSRRLPKIFDEIPKISERCRKLNVRRLFPKTFEHFRGYLKDDTFSVLWYDFVRREKRTQSHHLLRTICPDLWVRRKKLSLMREIQWRIQTVR